MGCSQSVPHEARDSVGGTSSRNSSNKASSPSAATKEDTIELAFKAKQRGNVFSQGIDDLTGYVPPKSPKTSAEAKLIRK